MMEINFGGLYMNNCNILFSPPAINYLGKLPRSLQFSKETYYDFYQPIPVFKKTKIDLPDYIETYPKATQNNWLLMMSMQNNWMGYNEINNAEHEVDPPVIECWVHGSDWHPPKFVFPWNVTHPRVSNSYNLNTEIAYSNWAWNFAFTFENCRIMKPFGVPIATTIIGEDDITYTYIPFQERYQDRTHDQAFYACRGEISPYADFTIPLRFPGNGHNCYKMFYNANFYVDSNTETGGSVFFDGGELPTYGSGAIPVYTSGLRFLNRYYISDPSAEPSHLRPFMNCDSMFEDATMPLFSNFCISAESMVNMFANCRARERLANPIEYVLNISGNDGAFMFYNAWSDQKGYDGRNFYIFANMYLNNGDGMFKNVGCRFNNSRDWEILSSAVSMYEDAEYFNCNTVLIGRKVEDSRVGGDHPIGNTASMFKNCRNFDTPVYAAEPSAITNTNSMFLNCNNFSEPVKIACEPFDLSYMFAGCSNFDSRFLFESDGMGYINMSHIFDNCSSLHLFPISILKQGTFMQGDMKDVEDPDGTPNIKWHWTRPEAYAYELGIAVFLEADPVTNNAGVGPWIDYSYAFNNCRVFNDSCGLYATQSLSPTFGCIAFTRASNASHMFDNCIYLNTPVNVLTYNRCFDVSYMFNNCTSFNQDHQYADEDSSGYYVSEVTNISGMFAGCSSYNQKLMIVKNTLDASNLFNGCSSLNVLPEFNDYNASDPSDAVTVVNMDRMFYKCSSFDQRFSIPRGVETGRDMFNGCHKLNGYSYYFPNSFKSAYRMFSNSYRGGSKTSQFVHIYLAKSQPSDFNAKCIFEPGINLSTGVYYAPMQFIVHGRNDAQLAPFLGVTEDDSVIGHPVTWSALPDGNGYNTSRQGYGGVSIWLYNNYVDPE